MTPHAGAAAVVPVLLDLGLTVGTAESLTGGLVAAALTSVPGASAVVRGGVVAYASDVKASVLGVDRRVLTAQGAVSAAVAEQLAQGVRSVLGCDVGLATTGVAGPGPADGASAGTVFLAVAGPWGILVEQHALTGDRDRVRAASVEAVLALLSRALHNLRDGVGGEGYGKTQHQGTAERATAHDTADDQGEEGP